MNTLKRLRNLLFPKICVFCGREALDEDEFVCENCSELLVRMQGKLCKTCGHAVHTCGCNVPKVLSAAKFVFWHNDIVKRFVGTMKDKHFEELFDYGALRMHKLICENEYYLSCDHITYVPRSTTAYKNAGVDPAYELASRISEKTGIPLVCYLESNKKQYDQKELSVKERRENVKGAFKMAKCAPTPYGKIILVDDVMTTGATSEACAKVLKKAGPCEVAGLFLTRTHHEELIK